MGIFNQQRVPINGGVPMSSTDLSTAAIKQANRYIRDALAHPVSQRRDKASIEMVVRYARQRAAADFGCGESDLVMDWIGRTAPADADLA